MSDQFEKIRLDKQSNFFDDLQSSLQKNNFNNKSDESNDEMSDDDETQNKPKQMQSSMKNPYFEMDQQIKQEQQKVKQQNLKIIDKIQESEQIIDPNKVVYEKSSGQERRNTNYRMSQEDMKKMRRDLNQKQIGNEKMASRYMPLPKSPVTIKSRLFNMRGLFDLKILERLNAIVYDGTQVKKEFDKIQNNLMAHVRECSLASENIVQQLELKLNPKLNKEDFYESDDSHQIQEIINQFYEKHQSSIETMEYNLKLIRQALLQADNLKLEKKEIDLNLQYKIEVVNVKLELPCGYNDVVGKLDDYTLALSMGEDITDLVQFTKSEIDSKVVQIQNLLSIKEKINMVLVHEERIICDRFVYKSKNFELIQQLEHESPFQSGVALNRNCFMSGHMNSAKLAIWRWNGEHYQLISKHAFMSGAHKHKVCQLEKDPYSSGNSVIMLTSNTLIQHINTIMSQLNLPNLEEEFQSKICICYKLSRYSQMNTFQQL
ncbi:hypothetical protein OXYTRIMIC_680 [Oxytricha trifallax]|uniref:Uncharacterized protein n=1 Tax=Oxytricha trifallax TaxID=1172189 RepID=A0A073HZ83_9SPIT|nr:hypothetical protein OXYTRIMIC_680 [Oxytricha trifallax]